MADRLPPDHGLRIDLVQQQSSVPDATVMATSRSKYSLWAPSSLCSM